MFLLAVMTVMKQILYLDLVSGFWGSKVISSFQVGQLFSVTRVTQVTRLPELPAGNNGVVQSNCLSEVMFQENCVAACDLSSP